MQCIFGRRLLTLIFFSSRNSVFKLKPWRNSTRPFKISTNNAFGDVWTKWDGSSLVRAVFPCIHQGECNSSCTVPKNEKKKIVKQSKRLRILDFYKNPINAWESERQETWKAISILSLRKHNYALLYNLWEEQCTNHSDAMNFQVVIICTGTSGAYVRLMTSFQVLWKPIDELIPGRL